MNKFNCKISNGTGFNIITYYSKLYIFLKISSIFYFSNRQGVLWFYNTDDKETSDRIYTDSSGLLQKWFQKWSKWDEEVYWIILLELTKNMFHLMLNSFGDYSSSCVVQHPSSVNNFLFFFQTTRPTTVIYLSCISSMSIKREILIVKYCRFLIYCEELIST